MLARPQLSIARRPSKLMTKPDLTLLADVVALIKSSLDVEACRSYLLMHAPALVARFDDLVAITVAEQD